MFQKHHYEWLARFAHDNMDIVTKRLLCHALAQASPLNFNHNMFEVASGIREYDEGVAALKRSATP